MTEQRSPNEEPIIELTDVVEPAADDDSAIIELTEVVATSPTTDENIIDLTDMVKTPQTENEIIDLVDVVADPPQADSAILPESEAAEQQISLGEEVKDDSASPKKSVALDIDHAEAPAPNASGPASIEDDLDFAPMNLDIEENKEADLFDSLSMKLEPELQGGSENDELDFNLSTQELADAIDLLDAKLAEDGPEHADQIDSLPPTITETQLEKALENVIRRMYGEKIDQLLNEAIDKTVTAEIENLKIQLLKASPED